MFKTWFCPTCGCHTSRFGVSKYSEFMGMYYLVTYRCKRCGSDEIMKFKDYMRRLASERSIEQLFDKVVKR